MVEAKKTIINVEGIIYSSIRGNYVIYVYVHGMYVASTCSYCACSGKAFVRNFA